jgi:transcriptional regulator with XRE-family HTH domain
MSKNNIKYYREKAGLTQAELAKKLNVSKSYISLKETGKRGISVEEAQRFAKALNVSVKKIFFA